jgi:hypothetical protein
MQGGQPRVPLIVRGLQTGRVWAYVGFLRQPPPPTPGTLNAFPMRFSPHAATASPAAPLTTCTPAGDGSGKPGRANAAAHRVAGPRLQGHCYPNVMRA